MLRNLTDDSTKLAKDPAKRYWSEIVGVEVNNVGMSDGVFKASESCRR